MPTIHGWLTKPPHYLSCVAKVVGPDKSSADQPAGLFVMEEVTCR